MKSSILFLCFVLGMCSLTARSQDQLPSNDVQLLAQTAKHAAYAEALVSWCTQKNAKGAAQYNSALRGWSERNHWSALEAGPVRTELSPGEYERLKAEATSGFNAHGFKTVFLCGRLPQVLSQAENDPSVQHGADLARMASAASPAATKTEPQTALNPPPRAPQVQAQALSVQRPQSVTPQAATQAPPAETSSNRAQNQMEPTAPTSGVSNSVAVGDATMTLGPGWAVTKSTADAKILQKAVKNATVLVALSLQPMQGTLGQSFPAAVRKNFPGEPLQLKYIHHGKTRGGLEGHDGARWWAPESSEPATR
jgi:hypothetical protein